MIYFIIWKVIPFIWNLFVDDVELFGKIGIVLYLWVIRKSDAKDADGYRIWLKLFYKYDRFLDKLRFKKK